MGTIVNINRWSIGDTNDSNYFNLMMTNIIGAPSRLNLHLKIVIWTVS